MKRLSKILIAGAALATGAAVVTAQADEKKKPADVEARAERLFDHLDSNKDGVVTKEDALAQGHARFDKADVDRDGVLTRAELDTVLARAPKAKRDKIMARYDTNHDGSITRAELDARIERRFAHFDKDNNGQVTKAEVHDAVAQRMKKHQG